MSGADLARAHDEADGAPRAVPGIPKPHYEIRVYIEGQPGYFSYSVSTLVRAMTHFGEITRGGYRRYDPDNGRFVWFSPRRIWEINVIGPGLDSNYPDTFCRT